MNRLRRPARINFKLLIILVLLTGVVGAGAVGFHLVRKRTTARRALEEGTALFAEKKWGEAAKELRKYLRQNPDDDAILKQYAKANLSVRPQTAENVLSAIDAYRRVLRHNLGEKEISDKLARLYLLIRDYENAAYVCDKRLEKAPDDVEASIMLTRVMMARSKPEDALKILDPLVRRNPSASVDAYAMLGRIAIDVDDSPAAVQTALTRFNEGVALFPQSPAAYINRAVFHLDDFARRKPADIASARADVEAASKLEVADPTQRLRLARVWVLVGGLDQARTILSELERVDPAASESSSDFTDPDEFRLEWFIVSSALHRRSGDLAALGALADRALNELPDRYRTAYLPAAIESYILAGRIEDARHYHDEFGSHLDEATRGRGGGDARLAILAARIALAANEPHLVINLLKPILALNPDNDDVRRLLADAYLRIEQDYLAMEMLREQTARRPDDWVAGAQLVREYFKRREWSKAFQQARICEAVKPNDPELKLLRIESEMLSVDGQASNAGVGARLKGELAALRAEHPRSAMVRMLESSIAERENRIDDAVRLLREALAECDDTHDATVQFVTLLNRRNRKDDAIAACREAVGQHPESVRLRLIQAQLELSAERYEEARKALEAGLVEMKDPAGRLDLSHSLARVRLLHLDREGGITMLKSIASQHPNDVASRQTLLEIREIQEDPALAQRYVNEIKAVEGDAGLVWRLHQARIWLTSDDWRSHTLDIIQYLNQCIDGRPQWWTRAVLLLGAAHERLDAFADGEALYRRTLNEDPSADEVADRLMRLLERQGRFADAEDVLNKYSRTAPSLDVHRLGVALGTGEYDRAIQELETRVAADPKASEPRVLLARLLYGRRKEMDRANKLLDEAAALAPDSLSPIGARVYILSSEKRYDEAQVLLDDEVAKRQDFATHLLRAEFAADRGLNEQAEKDFLRLTEFENTQSAGYELLGRFYYLANRQAEAIKAWEKGLELDAKRGSLKVRLMRALLATEDETERGRGRAILGELLKEFPDNSDLLSLRAKVLIDTGTPESFEQAKEVLERVTRIDHKAVPAFLALAEIAMSKRDYDAAREIATRGIEFNPGEPRLIMAAVDAERADRNPSLARDLARSALVADARFVPAYLFLIDDAILSGDKAGAQKLLDEVLAIAPEEPSVQMKQAAVLGATGQSSRAIEILEAIYSGDAKVDQLTLTMMLSDLYCESGDDQRFEEQLAKAEQLSPGGGVVARLRLRCLSMRRRIDEIPALLSAYHADHPKDTSLLLNGASVLMASGTPEGLKHAQVIYDQVISASPDSVEAYLGMAQAAYSAKNIDAVIRAYRSVLKVQPDHQQAINDLAWVLSEQGGKEEALTLASRGVDLYPADAHLRDTRGVILTKLDRLDEAMDDLNRAIDFAGDKDATRAQAMIHLADVFIKRGDKNAARVKLNEAKAIDDRRKVLTDPDRAKIAEMLGKL